jgi:hypothetical protein
MNEITIRYQLGKNVTTISIDGNKHDIAVILDTCRKRIFSGVESPEHDPRSALAITTVEAR